LIIAVIGAGNVGRALASRFSSVGHDVRLANSRGPHTLHAVADKTGATPQEVGAAIDAARVVVLAVPYHAVVDVAAASGSWTGKVVVDATNFFESRDGAQLRPSGQGSSAEVQTTLVGSRVVKAFNTIPAPLLLEPAPNGIERVAVPIAADDDDAAEVVGALISEIGLASVRVGKLTTAAPFLDPGGSAFGKVVDAIQLRALLSSA
jgi:predicted dinucleotide-binding enzyme